MRGSLLAALIVLAPAAAARAQDRAVPADTPRPTITVPAGTSLHTLLERPLTRRTSRPGASVYLQLDHPVVVHDTVALPAGTYLEGILDGVSGKTRQLRADLRLHLTRLVYGNGYVLATSQPAEGIAGDDVGDLPSPVASAAVLGGLVVGSAVLGLSAARHAGVPTAPILAPAVLLLPLALGAFWLRPALAFEEGTPVALVLGEPLIVDARRAMAPGATAFVPVRRPAPRPESQCYSPGIPGTPDTVIPGTPGTPDIVIPGAPGAPDVVIPGTPGTPPTVIPGTPGTPGTWYPC